MIFVGDIASPTPYTTRELVQFLEEHEAIFGKKLLIGNLEGLLSERNPGKDIEPILSNDPALPAALKQVTQPVFCLANNHILDLPEAFIFTEDMLRREGIAFGGAGTSPGAAEEGISFEENGNKIVLFNACWDFLLYNHRNPSRGVYVEEIDEEKLIRNLARYKESSPDTRLVIYLHWSLDLESLPFPMYRQFSRALIDAGASLVIGTHAHCVQGGEKYKDGYILYGLGNFFLPDHVYVGGRLKFPAFAKLELALEWNMELNSITCHWFEYKDAKKQCPLTYLGSDAFEESDRLKALSPFSELSDREYVEYFKRNRRKKLLIPVYRDYKRKVQNKCYTGFLKSRAHTARFMAKMKFIKWQN